MIVPITWQVVLALAPARSVVPIGKKTAGSPWIFMNVPGSDLPFEVLLQLETLVAPASWRSMLVADGTVQVAWKLLPVCDQLLPEAVPPDPQPRRRTHPAETSTIESLPSTSGVRP